MSFPDLLRIRRSKSSLARITNRQITTSLTVIPKLSKLLFLSPEETAGPPAPSLNLFPLDLEHRTRTFNFLDESTCSIPFTSTRILTRSASAWTRYSPTKSTSPLKHPSTLPGATASGVKRFMLLSASNYDPCKRICDQTHQHLMDAWDVESVIIKPMWYMGRYLITIGLAIFAWLCLPRDYRYMQHPENFRENDVPTTKANGTFQTTVGDGKVSWVSTEDAGTDAARALVDNTIKNSEHILLGPVPLSNHDVKLHSVWDASPMISNIQISLIIYYSQVA